MRNAAEILGIHHSTIKPGKYKKRKIEMNKKYIQKFFHMLLSIIEEWIY